MDDWPHLAALMQRTRRYWYEDGLWELATGGFFLVIALVLILQAVLPPNSWAQRIVVLGGSALVISGSIIGRRLVEQVKTRITYRRTGYVAYGREAQRGMLDSRAVWTLVAVALAVVLVGIRLGWWERALPLFFGVYGLVVLALVGYSLGLRRFYVLAVWSALAGIVIMLLPVSVLPGSALFWVAMGLGLMTSGATALRRYLSAAPEPSTEQ